MWIAICVTVLVLLSVACLLLALWVMMQRIPRDAVEVHDDGFPTDAFEKRCYDGAGQRAGENAESEG